MTLTAAVLGRLGCGSKARRMSDFKAGTFRAYPKMDSRAGLTLAVLSAHFALRKNWRKTVTGMYDFFSVKT